jgi:predicted DNA-binding transcriptional regulator AlpA
MPLPDSLPPLITIQEAARLCGGLHPKTLLRWAAKNTFPKPLRLGSSGRPTLRFRLADVQQFIADRGVAHA